MVSVRSDTSENVAKVSKKRSQDIQVANLKAQLKQALFQPLVARGVSTRYLTSGSRAIVNDLIEGASECSSCAVVTWSLIYILRS
jgi:ATP-dependent RNA helicase DDX24/MAK5